MKSIFVFATVIMFLSVVSVRGQTSADLSKRYPTITAYEVRPGILMTAQYAADGQVCRMTLEPRRVSKDSISLDVLVDDDLVNAFVDEVAPVESRGKPGQFDGLTVMMGQPAVTLQDYEFLTIRRYGTTRNIRGKQFLEPWVVTVTWNKRTCIN